MPPAPASNLTAVPGENFQQYEARQGFPQPSAAPAVTPIGGLPAVPASSLTAAGFKAANPSVVSTAPVVDTTKSNINFLQNFNPVSTGGTTTTSSTQPIAFPSGTQTGTPNAQPSAPTPNNNASSPTATGGVGQPNVQPPQIVTSNSTNDNSQKSVIDQINNLLNDPNVKAAIPQNIRDQIAASNHLDATASSTAASANTALANGDYQSFNDLIQSLKDMQTKRDKALSDLQSSLAPLRQKYLDSLIPSQNETDLQTQLADVTKKEQDFQLSLQQGEKAQYGLGRPLALSTGRAQQLSDNNQFTIANMQNEEKNLLTRLGLAQDARKITTDVLGKSMDFQLQDYDLQVKAQDAQQTAENQIFTQTSTLNTIQRQNFADILDSLKGSDPSKFSPDTQAQIAKIAAARGIPPSLLTQGLQTQYNGDMLDKLQKQLNIEKTKADTAKTVADTNKTNAETAQYNPSSVPSFNDYLAKSGVPVGVGSQSAIDSAHDQYVQQYSGALQPYVKTTLSGTDYADLSGLTKTDAAKLAPMANKLGIAIISNPNTATDLQNIDNAKLNLSSLLKGIAPYLPSDWVTRDFGGAAANSIQNYLQSSDAISAYSTFKDSAQEFLKAISGQQGFRGNQTAIQKIEDRLPNIWDTLGRAQQSVRDILQLIGNRESALVTTDRSTLSSSFTSQFSTGSSVDLSTINFSF